MSAYYFFEDGERYNPAEALKKLTKPKLLIYGDEDEFAVPQDVMEIYESLPRQKKA